MTEVKPDTPKICPEPGCPNELVWVLNPSPYIGGHFVCSATAREHELCAKLAAAEARVRELEEDDEALLAVLPEDFGAVEYIKHLTAANAALKEKLAEADRLIGNQWGVSPFMTAEEKNGAIRRGIERESSRKKGAEHGE